MRLEERLRAIRVLEERATARTVRERAKADGDQMARILALADAVAQEYDSLVSDARSPLTCAAFEELLMFGDVASRCGECGKPIDENGSCAG